MYEVLTRFVWSDDLDPVDRNGELPSDVSPSATARACARLAAAKALCISQRFYRYFGHFKYWLSICTYTVL